jgi:AraC family transcriptional regulator, activator of mtrCDE
MKLDRLLTNLDVRVEPFALCMLSKGWRLRLPAPPAVLLHFVLKGNGAVLGPEDDAEHVAPMWLSVVPAGAKHALETSETVEHELKIDTPPVAPPICRVVAGSAEDPALVVACGMVRVRYGESLGLFDHLRKVLAVDLSDRPELSAIFRTIMAEQAQPFAGTGTLTAALMTQCLVHLLRRLTNGGPLPWLLALENRRLAAAIDRILDDPGADHTVESLAEAASMSRSAFAERFVEAFGETPMHLVHHLRMQRAAHLIKQHALSIDEIASRMGFSSRSHFSQAFKKHTGATPAQFRDRADN